MGISFIINGQTESAAYTYDNVGRLKTSSQTTNSVTAKRSFDYDRWGNRTAVWDTSPKTPVQLQSVELVESSSIPNNQIESVTENSATSDYTYDAAGNVTDDDVNTYVYDAENRLVSINSGAEQYKYDHQNRRVAKTVGSVTTQYVWEGSKVIAEHAASTGTVLVDYIFMGGRMVKKVEGSATRYIVSDRLSARVILDEDYDVVGKQSHLPFGEAMAESGEQEKHKFTSYERDTSTGLDYAVNRWHSAGVGRFLQVDPIAGNTANPQRLNRYAYTKNNPINKVDPLGLDGVCGDGYRWDDYNSECVPDLGDIDGGTTYAGDDDEVDRWDDLPDGGLGGDWDPAVAEGDPYWRDDPNDEPDDQQKEFLRKFYKQKEKIFEAFKECVLEAYEAFRKDYSEVRQRLWDWEKENVPPNLDDLGAGAIGAGFTGVMTGGKGMGVGALGGAMGSWFWRLLKGAVKERKEWSALWERRDNRYAECGTKTGWSAYAGSDAVRDGNRIIDEKIREENRRNGIR